jgi:hypothetical protein
MLSMSDFIREFPVVLKTDRDCETPLVIEWLNSRPDIKTVLDIGAHYSGHHYARAIRPFLFRYDGIDIQPPDDATRALLDHYYTGNANTFSFEVDQYDAVICVSTIEHAGVSTYQGDYVTERMSLFQRCLALARKHMWISFPVGQPYVCPGQMAIITAEHLDQWERWTAKYRVKERFFLTQGAQAGHPWREHTNREAALSVPYFDYIGNQSICVMEVDL